LPDGKTGRLVFTLPSAEEEQHIREGLASYIPEKAVNQLLLERQLVIGKGRRYEVFLLSPVLWHLYQQAQPQNPYFIGLFLGELKTGTLQPSLHVLHRLADAVKPSVKVSASSKGEQKFVYGHSLEAQEFTQEVTGADEPKQVLVVNQRGEGLGYGQIIKAPTGEQLLKNQLDLGWYLRRGQ
jgi:ribosome biogenesis protein Nip4